MIAYRLTLEALLDFCVYSMVPSRPFEALVLLACSHVVFTFQLRPFSNSIEAVLVALALSKYASFLHHGAFRSDQVKTLPYLAERFSISATDLGRSRLALACCYFGCRRVHEGYLRVVRATYLDGSHTRCNVDKYPRLRSPVVARSDQRTGSG